MFILDWGIEISAWGKLLAGGGGRTEKKIVKTSWNKSYSSSRARMLMRSP